MRELASARNSCTKQLIPQLIHVSDRRLPYKPLIGCNHLAADGLDLEEGEKVNRKKIGEIDKLALTSIHEGISSV